VQDYFASFHKKEIFLPERFLPDINFLEKHFEERFIG